MCVFHTLRACFLASPIRSALPGLRYGLRRMPLCQQYLQGTKYSVRNTGLRIPPVLAVRLHPYRGGAWPLQPIPRFSFGTGIIVMHRAPPRLICFFQKGLTFVDAESRSPLQSTLPSFSLCSILYSMLAHMSDFPGLGMPSGSALP